MHTNLINQIHHLINEAKTFAIVCHKRPDGDAISSSLAMFWYLTSIGKKENNIDIIIPEFNKELDFMPGINQLKKEATKKKYDLTFVLDCANLSLLNEAEILKISTNIICIDHHEANSTYTEYSFIDTTASSCTAILYSLFKCTNLHFLECIAIGIISDTSNLTLNVTSKTKQILKELEQFGIDTKTISSKLTSQNDRTQELTKLVLERSTFSGNDIHKIFCSYILQSDLLDCEKNLTLVNHKSIIQKIQNSTKFTSLILLVENKKSEFKVSLRTFDTNINLNDICNHLKTKGRIIKGGGHSYSAGCTVLDSKKNIFEFLTHELLNYINTN